MSDARERPAAQPPKKRMSRGTRVLVIIVCVLLAIALILVGVVLVLATLTTLPVTTAQAASPTTERVVTLTPKKTNYVSKASPKKVYSKKSTIRASKAAYASYLDGSMTDYVPKDGEIMAR